MSSEDLYNDFTKIMNEQTEETVGKRLRKPVDGLDEETMKLCEERRRARTRMLSNSTNDEIRSDYNVINKAVKKAVKQAKIKALEKKTNLLKITFEKTIPRIIKKYKRP